MYPTISIIIAVKNAKNLLGETLLSIQSQTYPSLEVIVIDGASTDGTVELLEENQHWLRFISEPDAGISDAFNKGVRLAKGHYINFQGAGDIFYSSDCIAKLFENVNKNYSLVCGKVMRVKEDGMTPIWIAPRKVKFFKKSSLLFKLTLPHQGLFTHRDFFIQYGLFDTSLKFAMDYEHLLRAYHQFPPVIIKDVIVSKWREGGVGTHKILEIFDEYHKIKQMHRIAPKVVLKAIDKLNHIKYFIKTKCLNLQY